MPITVACRVLGVSRSGYYRWSGAVPSPRACDDATLAAEIQEIYHAHKGRYGSPRIHRELRAGGRRVSRKRVARVMRGLGLRGRPPRRFRRTTDSRHTPPDCSQRPGARVHPHRRQPRLGRGHHLCADARGVAVSGGAVGCVLAARGGLGAVGHHRHDVGPRGARHGPPPPAPRGWARASHGPRLPLRERRLPGRAPKGRDGDQHESSRGLLGYSEVDPDFRTSS